MHEMAESCQHTDKASHSQSVSQLTAFLTVVVPNGRLKDMCRILKPFYKSVACLDTYLHIREADSVAGIVDRLSTHDVPHYSVNGDEMSSPSLAIILFLPEFGPTSADGVRRKFDKLPWRHHHTIQLQKFGSADVLGKHKFYFLSRQLPLWSVGVSPHVSFVRFNLFVRRFNAMVEFYRLITGTEMESRKPGFSVFSIGNVRHCETLSAHQTACELVLKHSPQVSPYPLRDAFLTFPVRNLPSLLKVLPTRPHQVFTDTYILHDPDGNPVLLYEANPSAPRTLDPAAVAIPNMVCPGQTADKASVHSDSIDSGRYSDFEACSCELEQCMNRLAAVCKVDHKRGTCTTFQGHPEHQTCQKSGRHRTAKCDLHKTYEIDSSPGLNPPLSCKNPALHDPIYSPHKTYTSNPIERSRGINDCDTGLKVKGTNQAESAYLYASCPHNKNNDRSALLQTNALRSELVEDLKNYGYLHSLHAQEDNSVQAAYDITYV